MPLLETDYDQHFVLLEESVTVANTLEKLQAAGGADDWHIFVKRADNIFGAIRVSILKELLASVGPSLFEMELADLHGEIPDEEPIDPNNISLGTAEDWAKESNSSALVVRHQGQVIGRFVRLGDRSGEDIFPGSSLSQLYGEYITVAPDDRANWRPTNVPIPICLNCGHVGFYQYDTESNVLRCANCHHILPRRRA